MAADTEFQLDSEDLLPESDEFGVPPTQDETLRFLDADLGDFLKKPGKSAKAKAYERKVHSVLTGALKWTIKTPQGLPDAAAIIAYGDGFAAAAGDLADASERAAKVIDFITAPDNPALVFALMSVQLGSQLIRNHQDQLQAIPAAVQNRKTTTKAERKAARDAKPGINIKIPFIKKTFKLRVALHMGFLTAQSVDPHALTEGVFSNPSIVKQLEKQGIHIGRP